MNQGFAPGKALTLRFLTKMEEVMNGVVQFIRSLFFVAIMMGAAGTLVEATGCVGREAAKAHQHGGMSFRCPDRWISRVKIQVLQI